VSAQSIPRLYTVEEYERIPNPPGGRYELHHGELVFVTYPVRQHGDLQRRLQELLKPAGAAEYLVAVEYPYRPLRESEVWGADVACVRHDRHRAVEKWLLGAPELVIEVKSPSNRDSELDDKAMTTLAGEGAVEFWVVDAKARTVKVYSKSAGVRIYHGDAEVPVPLLDMRLSLDQIFAE
jgi:Uma2 family endonuclease